MEWPYLLLAGYGCCGVGFSLGLCWCLGMQGRWWQVALGVLIAISCWPLVLTDRTLRNTVR